MIGNKGIATIDFLFALVVAFGMSAIVFSLTFTLSVVEVAQYIVFSAARAHSAGNYDKQAQDKAAREKYNALISSPAFAPLFQNGWFEIAKTPELEIKQGGGNNFSADYPSASGSNREVFQGVRTKLKANMLELKLPLLGKITPEDGGFTTKVAAILLREPTVIECTQYMKDRGRKLWEVGGGRFSRFRNSGGAVPWEDNGC